MAQSVQITAFWRGKQANINSSEQSAASVFSPPPPLALWPNKGHGLLILEVSRSHTTTHHNRQDSSGRVISSSHRPLPDNTQHSQQTNIHVSGGIRTHDLCSLAAAELRIRPHCYWDRQCLQLGSKVLLIYGLNLWKYTATSSRAESQHILTWVRRSVLNLTEFVSKFCKFETFVM